MSDPNIPIVPTEDSSASTPQDSSFGDILSAFEREHEAPKGAETLAGTVVSINPDSILLDIGRKMEGYLSLEDYRRSGASMNLKKGDSIEVTIRGTRDDGYYDLGTIRVERPKDWTSIQKAYDEKSIIAGRVVESVKGGLRVDVGVRAFMPASRSGAKDVPEMEKLIGQDIECRIIKLEIDKEDVVVDRRAVLEEQADKVKKEAFSQIKEGDVRQGSVRSLTEFGAFVDIGGFDGLVHVTDMSWNRSAKPGDLLSVGDVVQVKVLKINPEKQKISLGMKQLMPEPWTLIGQKYKVGDRVKGRVVRITDFGAFVEIESGIDGMIHLSEMSWSKKVRKPSDLVKVGDQVETVVLSVKPEEKRIGLGLKQALGDPWEEAEKKYPVGSVVEAPITNLAKFGAFVDLGDGVEGMIHIGDISHEKRLNHPSEVLKPAETVKAQVLEIDRERRRIRLGLKQLEPTEADKFIAEHKIGDTISGRLVEVHASAGKVEVADRVIAICRFKKQEEKGASQSSAVKVDVSTATALLAARWKKGEGGPAPDADVPKPGQVRQFKIAGMDPIQKRIELEMA